MEYISLIYKLLVLQLLMPEANSSLERLGLDHYTVSSPFEACPITGGHCRLYLTQSR